MRGVVIGALLAGCVAPSMALAQAENPTPAQAPAAADAGGEIIVTAQKRAERLQDVPVAISVETQALLERQQVNTITDLSRLTPALEIQQGGTGSGVGGGGQIRGIGTISTNQGAAPAVGIVVDQVSQGTTNISDLFDVNRIEVLKGPQGTLFGLTTSAGVINIITNKPDPTHFSARILTELTKEGVAGSGYGNQVVQGMVNIPLAANAALRLTGNTNLLQGINFNTLTGKRDRHNSFGFRGRFLWEPTNALTINVIGDYTKADARADNNFTITRADPNFGGGAANPFNAYAALARCGITPSSFNHSYCSLNPAEQHSKTFGGSVQIDYDVKPFTLTSITSYRRQLTGPDSKDVFSIASYPLVVLDGPAHARDGLFTQEFRVASHTGAKLEYTLGTFISASRQHADPDPNNVLAFGQSIFPAGSQQGVNIEIKDDSMAVFGQSTLHLGDHLRLIGGARYTEQKLSVLYHSLDVSALVVPVASGYIKTNISNFSWKVGAQYEFSRNLQAYTTVSRGYKGPQIALGDPTTIILPTLAVPNPVQPPGSSPSIVKPEIPTSYEFGVKGNFLHNMLSADLSVFYVKVVNYQTTLSELTGGGINIIAVPANIPSIKSKGVELNITARPFTGLSFNVGGIYNPVKYPNGFVGEDGSDLTNAQLKFVPKYKITASGEYEHNLSSRFKGFISGDLVYKSALRLDVRNNSGPAFAIDDAVVYPGHVMLGGRIGLRGDDDRWDIAIFARNLTNNHEPSLIIPRIPPAFGRLQSTAVGTTFTPQSFRQVGLSLDARF